MSYAEKSPEGLQQKTQSAVALPPTFEHAFRDRDFQIDVIVDPYLLLAGPGSRIEKGIQGWSGQAARELQAGGAYLRLEAGGAKPEYGLLFWLWDPDTHLFLWNFRYRGADPAPNRGDLE